MLKKSDAKNGLTKKGIVWELINSVWVLYSFFALAWIGFFYIGKAAQQRKWILWGCAYIVILSAGLFVLGESVVPEGVKNIAETLIMGVYIFSIVHSFKVRKEFLIRREIILELKLKKNQENDLKNKIRKEYISQQVIQNQEKNKIDEAESVPQGMKDAEGDKLTVYDINACTEQELASLPGITSILAKKAIAYRRENNGFSSLQEFVQVLDIKPHFYIQMKERIVCKPGKNVINNDKTGRVLDL